MSSIKIRTKQRDNKTQVRMLITHPMENGRKKDQQGNLIQAHHIQELWVDHNGNRVITCTMAGGISKNPYFDFFLNDGNANDKITVSWLDNLGQIDSKDHIIK